MKKNIELRQYLMKSGVYLWELAEKLEITDSTLSRKLRIQLDEDELNKMFALIDNISKKGASING